MESFNKLIVGTTGVGSIELVNAVIPPTADEITSVGQLFLQAIVAIATIIGIFRKKRNSNP